MPPLKWLLVKPGPSRLQPSPIDVILPRLRGYSRLGIVLVAIWFVGHRQFWGHWFVVLCAMAFAALMLPTEMMFFVRHPVLASAVPLAAGFVAANLGRSVIRTVAAWAVVAVLVVATYRSLDADPVTGPWLRSHLEVAVPPQGFRSSKTLDDRQSQGTGLLAGHIEKATRPLSS